MGRDGKEYLNAQVGEDSELYRDFERFEELGGYQTRSEAVRAAVRLGIRQALDERSSTEEDSDSERSPVSHDLEGSGLLTWGTLVSLLGIAILFSSLIAYMGLVLVGVDGGVRVKLLSIIGFGALGLSIGGLMIMVGNVRNNGLASV